MAMGQHGQCLLLHQLETYQHLITYLEKMATEYHKNSFLLHLKWTNSICLCFSGRYVLVVLFTCHQEGTVHKSDWMGKETFYHHSWVRWQLHQCRAYEGIHSMIVNKYLLYQFWTLEATNIICTNWHVLNDEVPKEFKQAIHENGCRVKLPRAKTHQKIVAKWVI